MKRIFRFLTAAVIMALILPLSGCQSGSGEANAAGSSETETEEVKEDVVMIKKFYADKESVKHLGRAYFEDNTLWCAHSGTGAEFQVKAKSVKITITGDSAVSGGIDNRARIAIFCNGESVIDEMLGEPEKTFTVFESGGETDVEVKVIKLSESAMSFFGIKEIEAETSGVISPVPDKDTLIEFVGDSITCGYGVEDEDRNHHFSTETENFMKTYAYKTAEALDADYSAAAFSGYGIISGYSTGDKVEAQTLPQYYDKVGFSYGSANGFKPQTADWDFEATRKPDIIVINLGTNDDSYCQNDEAKQAEFSAAYAEFLGKVRSLNPEAHIICSLGIMGDRLYPFVEEAAAKHSSDTGDDNISCLRFDVQQASDGYAADWHPTEVTHGKAADKLINEIKSRQ